MYLKFYKWVFVVVNWKVQIQVVGEKLNYIVGVITF